MPGISPVNSQICCGVLPGTSQTFLSAVNPIPGFARVDIVLDVMEFVIVQVVAAVLISEGIDCALRCDRMAATR